MVQVTIEIKGKTDSRRVRVTAPSVEQALEMAGAGRSGRRVRVIFWSGSIPFSRDRAVTGASPPTASERAA